MALFEASEQADSVVILAVLAGLGAAFAWGLGCLLFDRAQARGAAGVKPPTAAGMNLFKNTIACSTFFAASLILGQAMPAGSAVPMLLLSGVVGFALGDSMYFAAFPKAGVQLTAMMGNLTPPLAAVISWLWLGDTFGLATMFWMSIVFMGISLVVMDPVGVPKRAGVDISKADRRVGIALAFGSALCQAVGIVMAYAAFEDVDVLPGTVLRLAGGIALALPIAMLLGKAKGEGFAASIAEVTRPLRNRRLFALLIVPTVVATVISLPMHSYCIRGAPAHLSALVLATSPLFILPLGRFFGARHGKLSVLGTLLGFGGLAGVLFS